MGKIRLLLLICTLLLTGIFSSCEAEKPEPVELTVKVSIVYKNEKLLDNYPIVIKTEGDNPTIISAIKRACEVFEFPLKLSDDEMSVKSISNHAETDTALWLWKINGEEPKDNAGKAGAYEIKDGDNIYYYFEELELETTKA